MEDNQINDSLQVNSGRRVDYRENPWPSVAAALLGITGEQRIKGQFIPVELPNGIVYPHHFVEGQLIPFDGKIDQPDQLIYSGFTLSDDEEEGTIVGSRWRVSDYPFTLPEPVTYPIDPVAPGLFRADYIIGTPTGTTEYLKGEAGATYVPPILPYKHILIQEIRVSDATVTSVDPEIPVSDGEVLYGLGTPDPSLGKVGDVYKNKETGADFGKEYKKKLLAGVASWVLEYTPAAGGGSSTFASLTDAPRDNVLLNAELDAKADLVDGKVPAAQLPSYVDDVIEVADEASLPVTGESGKIYITLDDDAQYRWSGSVYVLLVSSPGSTDAVPEGSVNKYFTADRVLATVLTAISFGSADPITAVDTVLSAFGKLQAQITAIANKIGGALSTLTTTDKSSIIAAINEVNAKPTGSAPIQVNNVTILSTGWLFTAGRHEYTYSNASILSTSIVDITPKNDSVETVRTADVLPQIDVAAGSAKLYANNEPDQDITVNIVIL